MKRCSVCGTPFTYSQLLKSLWTGYRDTHCRSCGTEYRHLPVNRLLFAGTAIMSVGLAVVVKSTVVSNFRSSYLVVPLLFVFVLVFFSLLLVPLLQLEPRARSEDQTDRQVQDFSEN